MPVVTTAVSLAAAAAASIAGVSYQAVAASDAEDQANAARNKQEQQANALIAQAKEQDQLQKNTQQDLIARNAARVRSSALTSAGRSSTILTSPLGVTNTAENVGTAAPAKTLLGQ